MTTIHEWDARHRSVGVSVAASLWEPRPTRSLLNIVEGLPPRRALDLATGDGRNALWLAAHGWKVQAVDWSAAGLALAKARAKAENANIDWVTADAREWEPVARFDLITVTYLHLPATEFASVIKRATSWLAPRGHLVVIGHDVSNRESAASGPTDPAVLYTAALLSSLAKENGLTVLCSSTAVRATAEYALAAKASEPVPRAIDTVLHAVAPDEDPKRPAA